ncbi:Serine/threonine-protein phosphatase with EF-hands 2 [Oryzias melastigma]|uniref:Serine/threonine-protein phosphatase with EF-hands n=1 Tax=Oryzias melastigma TaxID=30732 RepID=A0A834CIV6_ORYME|nr:Serine/threonine-protein phosphatase with EF-hands 2 [Oryzias melastigma]
MLLVIGWFLPTGTVMGCGVSKSNQFHKHSRKAIRAAVLIQRWYRQYVARTEMRRRYTWNIFQSIEYSGEQAQIKLYNFLGYLMDNFTPSSSERNLISHIFRENDICRDAEWERYFCYKNIEVPEVYSGPHLTFPLTVEQASLSQQQLHSRYVLQLLLETWKLLRMLPNINRISTCHSKEITICGDLHGQLEDLLLIFYKNGMPSLEKPYVFNGDFVDRGKDSIEILLILFSFLLIYPCDVYLNRGNHEDHIINLRYGFTKEVLTKYRVHGKRILKLLQKIFSWLPLATVIDQKVLVLHGGISDTTDLAVLAKLDRHIYVSALRPPKKRNQSLSGISIDMDIEDEGWGTSRVFQRRASLTYSKSLGTRSCFQNRSLQDFSGRIKMNMENELEIRRKQSVFLSDIGKPDKETLTVSTDSVSSDNSKEEWRQILDLLWSDPMIQNGCKPNEVRGGGCYWGPDITEDFLNKHNLQLLIRSHECKQEGYEFCHNRKVLTLFSASNYYDVGSNRGAYVKLGPDLEPYVIQYQASSMTRELTAKQSIGRTERSALKVLREQLFAHKSDLLYAFRKFDTENAGLVSLSDWASAVESVMHLNLPWRMLRCQLVTCKGSEGMIDYNAWFDELAIKGANADHIEQTLLEMLYRHRSTLETIFRIVDTDNSGFISMEDFRQTWKLLSVYLKMEITDDAISDLAVTIDSNHDGSIDIDEFMEAFRLTDKKSRLERGRSMFMGTATDLTKLDADPNV